jgi:hypothetical protein
VKPEQKKGGSKENGMKLKTVKSNRKSMTFPHLLYLHVWDKLVRVIANGMSKVVRDVNLFELSTI